MKISDIENNKAYYVVYKEWNYLKISWGMELRKIYSGEKLIQMFDSTKYIILNFWKK